MFMVTWKGSHNPILRGRSNDHHGYSRPSCRAVLACFFLSSAVCLCGPLVVVVLSFWLPLLFVFSPFSPFVFVACGAFFLRASATWPGDFLYKTCSLCPFGFRQFVMRATRPGREKWSWLVQKVFGHTRSPCTSMIIGCLGALRILNSCVHGRFFYPSSLCCFCCFLVRF